MSIDKSTVERIAELSKLKFEPSEQAEILNDMNRMLDFVEKLSEVDTEGVEPLVYMLDEKPTVRLDKVVQTTSQAEALKNAPDADTDYIKVPKVMKGR
jgi:aspartyl-tRNA(Asn)/glutamyl-tRNA(Gln) amidotransferase subunit C